MPYHLELGSEGAPFPKGKAIVVTTATGKHHSLAPIPIAKAKAQKRVLEAAEKKEDPCWKGYTQYGMKKKGGRKVPNCVPDKE